MERTSIRRVVITVLLAHLITVQIIYYHDYCVKWIWTDHAKTVVLEYLHP